MSAWLRPADLMQHSITLRLGQKHFSEPGGMFPVSVFLKNMFVPTEHKQAGCTCTLNQLFNLVSKSHIVCWEPYVCKMYEMRRGRKRNNEKKEDALCQSCREREKQTEKAWVSCSSSQVKKNKQKKPDTNQGITSQQTGSWPSEPKERDQHSMWSGTAPITENREPARLGPSHGSNLRCCQSLVLVTLLNFSSAAEGTLALTFLGQSSLEPVSS